MGLITVTEMMGRFRTDLGLQIFLQINTQLHEGKGEGAEVLASNTSSKVSPSEHTRIQSQNEQDSLQYREITSKSCCERGCLD